MANHKDDAKAGEAPLRKTGATARQEKLARALKANLARRKQAVTEAPPPSPRKAPR